jgi:hypothetical protein
LTVRALFGAATRANSHCKRADASDMTSAIC